MSLLPANFVVGYFYVIGLTLIAASAISSGAMVWSPILFGLILILGSLFSRTDFGLVKQLPIAVSAMIWCVTSIIIAFLPYLFNFTTLRYNDMLLLLWICIGSSVLNLVVILIGQISLDQTAKV